MLRCPAPLIVASIVGLGLGLGLGSVARADVPPAVRAHAVRRAGSIAIDGKLDEPAWAAAPRQTGFVQRFPSDGSKPTFSTQFAIMYDDDAVFVGVWADDPRPELIRALLTRRDVDAPADAVTVAFDSYHDRRTAYAFQLNAAGVQRDALLFDDSSQDDTWDAVWTGDVATTPTGWTAEYRIPLSQLRFARNETQEWGVQVVRLIGRTGEQDSWSPWPRSAPQVVSKFGVLDGIDHLKSATRLELLPYASAGVDRMPVEAGDPLNARTRLLHGVGLDLKYGLGPAFTISATLNPDFGQAEADPSQVNLSVNELFFAEKRPFFIEGMDLFKLPLRNNDGGEAAFYSRRIGAQPSDPDVDFTYIKRPDTTTIYGAAKLTGKTSTGWSVGVLDAVTGQESAEIITPDVAAAPGTAATESARQEPVVAALTNYMIARVKRDFGEGKTSIGASATAVNRKLDGTGLEATLHDQAYSGGLQATHRWADNAWTANLSVMGSWVHGSKDAIAATQQNARHFFQRPDASDVHFDPNRTSLSGATAKWMVGQLGDTKHWRYAFAGDVRTPGLELNDAGYQQNSDRVIPFVLVEYHENAPSAHLLNWLVSSDVFSVNTFEPRLLEYGLEYNANAQLSNYWQISGGGNLDRSRWATTGLRGGRALRVDGGLFNYVNVSTDNRKPVTLSLNASGSHNPTSGSYDGNLNLGATVQARSNLDFFVGPSIYARNDPMQYVAVIGSEAALDSHFIFARIHETDVSMTMRVNWAFSPHLTLQAYAQPFISSVHFNQFKDVNNPGADRFSDRFRMLSGSEFAFTEASTPAALVFDRPDFNFRQLRSTVVLRWEYRPGSTVFAIWRHGRTDDTFGDGRFHVGRDLSDLATAASENVVMVKANYWIGL
jgi:Domain of unknown function (DUF5916)/Carbohydrate family 9 binding domain-like